jgi:hypothetical protein
VVLYHFCTLVLFTHAARHHQGWGLASLDQDAADIRLLAECLAREHSCSAWVLMGHSTGCQDAVRCAVSWVLPALTCCWSEACDRTPSPCIVAAVHCWRQTTTTPRCAGPLPASLRYVTRHKADDIRLVGIILQAPVRAGGVVVSSVAACNHSSRAKPGLLAPSPPPPRPHPNTHRCRTGSTSAPFLRGRAAWRARSSWCRTAGARRWCCARPTGTARLSVRAAWCRCAVRAATMTCSAQTCPWSSCG